MKIRAVTDTLAGGAFGYTDVNMHPIWMYICEYTLYFDAHMNICPMTNTPVGGANPKTRFRYMHVCMHIFMYVCGKQPLLDGNKTYGQHPFQP